MNYYDLLGISRQSSRDQIKVAYKKRILEVHPDRNPGGEELFIKVHQAYDTLISPCKKRVYDFQLATLHNGCSFGYATPHGLSKCGGASRPNLFRGTASEWGGSPSLRPERFGSFGEWYRRKLGEFARADAAEQAELRERAGAELRRDQMRRAQQRRGRLERARALRADIAEAQRQFRHEAQARAKAQAAEAQARAEAQAAELRAQAEKIQRIEAYLAELKKDRQQLHEAKKHMHEEREQILREISKNSNDPELSRIVKQQQRQEEINEAKILAEKRLKEVQAHHLKQNQEIALKAMNKIKEEKLEKLHLESINKIAQEQQKTLAQDQMEMTEKIAKQKKLIDENTKRTFEEIKLEREKQKESIQSIRRETDMIEAEMLQKLEEIRIAKREGKQIVLENYTIFTTNHPIT